MKTKSRILYIAICVSPILLILGTLFIGRYGLNAREVLNILRAGYFESNSTAAAVIWDIRMPRAILGLTVGGSLAIAGGALQGIFRNPLVDSGMLGVSSGAGFGACVAIILFNSMTLIYISAFIFGIIAVALSYMAGRVYKGNGNISIVLGGIIISSIFSSLIALAKYSADPYQELPAITFWLMGSLAVGDYRDIAFSSVPIIIGTIGIILMRWRINVLSIGDREAKTLGLNVRFCRNMIIICASLATAGAVCVSGTIGWIGLVIPHIARMIFGNDNRKILPISFALGGSFLIIVDNMARLISGGEMPLGVLTALIGGPFYIYLLKRTKGGNWS